jgi:hypothetical protein
LAGFEHAWVTSQLKLRERYLDAIRRRVLAGQFRLTAASAKALGIAWDEDGALLESRGGAQADDPSGELRTIRDQLDAQYGGRMDQAA